MIILRKYFNDPTPSSDFTPTNSEIDLTPNSTDFIPQENETEE